MKIFSRIAGSVHIQSVSSIAASATTSPALCTTSTGSIFTADGAYTAFALGVTAPYSWYENDSAQSNLATGYYPVYVTDANGCSAFSQVYVPYITESSDCYCTISGYVYEELNGNCTKDINERGISGRRVGCSGNGYIFT